MKIASTSFSLGKISHCFSVDFDVAEDENWDNDICTRPCRLSVNRRGIYSQVSLKRGRQEMEKAIVGHRSRVLSACLSTLVGPINQPIAVKIVLPYRVYPL